MNRTLISAATRTVLSGALLLTLSAPAVFAQAAPAAAAPVQADSQLQHRGHNPHKAAMALSQQLGLSQDQTAKLEPILAQRRDKMKALKADTTLTPDQKKAQRKAIMDDTRTQMGTVLTPDQMTALKQMHHDRKHAAKTQS